MTEGATLGVFAAMPLAAQTDIDHAPHHPDQPATAAGQDVNGPVPGGTAAAGQRMPMMAQMDEHGFVVARFGLFLRLFSMQRPGTAGYVEPQSVSNVVGIALVLVGTACMVLGAVQHWSYVSTLPSADIPRSHDARYPIALAIFLAVVGLVLAAYLAV
jgi:uncharacterized membrane protein YidH (DUF202 family)